MFYVYVLKCKKAGQIYVGFTTDLKSRIKEHNNGEVKSTSYRRPLKLIYYEAYENRDVAQKRERQIKFGKAHIALLKRLKPERT